MVGAFRSYFKRDFAIFKVNSIGLEVARMRCMRIDLSAINPITSEIIKGAVEVHRRFGPGLLESVYHQCFAFEMNRPVGLLINFNVPLLKDGVSRKLNPSFTEE
jgi:PD-(D/E)XK nuclease superfamily protein